MPKIDWSDDNDDQPRWEPRHRISRERLAWREAMRRWPVPMGSFSPQPLAPNHLPDSARRPLHLIWGEPKRSSER